MKEMALQEEENAEDPVPSAESQDKLCIMSA